MERRLVNKLDSQPDPSWVSAKCKVHRANFTSYNDALQYEESLSFLTDTENDDR